MPSFTSSIAAAALLSASAVSAHGHVKNIVVDNAFYQGWDTLKGMGYNSNFPDVVGWSNTAMDNGFVAREAFATPDIICHLNGNASAAYASVAAGGTVQLDWSDWPDSHKGPVIDYMAACPETGCTTEGKTALEWFKVSEVGLIDNSMNSGYWASDLLIKNGKSWQVQIPTSLAPGIYVLRHEIIALHGAGTPQNYPQCITLQVTGTGSDKPSGVTGDKLYTSSDPIWDFSLYTGATNYAIPGPTLLPGAAPILEQKSVAPASTIEPTPYGGGGAAAPTYGSNPTSATTPAAAPTTPAAAPTTPAAVPTAPSVSTPTYQAPAGTSSADAVSTPAANVPAVPNTPASQPTSSQPTYGSQPATTPAAAPKTCSKKRRRSHARDVRNM
ncbi:Polysaccharide monooxygenase Cel61a [Ceratocystis lukuohia]|uniref:lytic cellulose monooxygenase (C4-dehydrogenating) n=2 Tax=Ceratocystis TaxID=5157 RepID=A0A0F8AY87_CERFI|nr:Endoglucanase-4 [Ceratocystis platani]